MLIPIRDENPSKQFPAVTVTLICLNLILYLWDRGGNPFGPSAVFNQMTMVPADVTAALNGGPKDLLLNLFTCMFLHASIAHILGNMLFLWIFGNNVEDTFGSAAFLGLYLFWGLAASALHIYIDPTNQVPVLGASGAIAGVLGSYLMLFPHARIDTLFWAFFAFVLEVPAWALLGVWFIMQALMVYFGTLTGVAAWAHIGGFMAGMITVLVLGGRARLLRKSEELEAVREQQS